jgi:hypothetical protein
MRSSPYTPANQSQSEPVPYYSFDGTSTHGIGASKTAVIADPNPFDELLWQSIGILD